MADNLKIVEDKVVQDIDPNGAPESILAQNHQDILKQVLSKSGKFSGFYFVAEKNPTSFTQGVFSWVSNSMGETGSFQIIMSKTTSDLNDVGLVLNLLTDGSLIHFKDYKGRSSILTFNSFTLGTDITGNDIYTINVTGNDNNPNYIYQDSEKNIASIEFITSGAQGDTNTFNNALTKDALGNVTLEGSLLKNTNIDIGLFNLIIDSSESNRSSFTVGQTINATSDSRVQITSPEFVFTGLSGGFEVGVNSNSGVNKLLQDPQNNSAWQYETEPNIDDDLSIVYAKYVRDQIQNKADLVNGTIPSNQLPSYVDDVVEGEYIDATTFNDTNSTPISPLEQSKIYVDIENDVTYRWSGSMLVQLHDNNLSAGSGVQITPTGQIRLGSPLETFTQIPLNSNSLRIGDASGTSVFITPTFLSVTSSGSLLMNGAAGGISIGTGTGVDTNISLTPVNGNVILQGNLSLSPNSTNALIDSGPVTTLITKDWFNNNIPDVGGGPGINPTGLESINEGNGAGLAIIGRNPNNYGNIGLNATDLSISNTTSTDRGAIGISSFAIGVSTKAEGTQSFAGGLLSQAIGLRSFAFGADCLASGANSVALQGDTEASGVNSMAIGTNTIANNQSELATGIAPTVGNNSTPVTDTVYKGRLFAIGDSTLANSASNPYPTRTNIFEVYANQGIVIRPKPTGVGSHPDEKAGMIRTSGSDTTFLIEVFDGVNWRTITLT